LLFGLAVVISGVSLISFNLYSTVAALAFRGAWLALSSILVLVLVGAFYFWRSPLVTRLVILFVLAVLSFVASPILERMLA